MYKQLSKFLLGLFLTGFFVVLGISDAGRYGYENKAYGSPPNYTTLCDTDGDIGDPKCATPITTNLLGNPCPGNLVLGTASGTMRCWKWDSTPPQIASSLLGGVNNWITDSQTKLTFSDTGGSGNKFARYKIDGNACSGTGFTDGTIITLPEGKSVLYLCAEDNAGNQTTDSIDYWIDTTAPTIGDFTITLEGKDDGGNLLANDNADLNFNYTDSGSGSPIVIKYKLEDKTTANLGSTIIVNHSSPPNTTVSWDISLVDNNREADGSRLYNTNVQLCDEAGNCSSTNNYDWNVYTNTPVNYESENYSTFDSTKIGDFDDTFVAGILLEDEYGNKVIPASGIGREIGINIVYDNTVYLNQYDVTGTGGIYYKVRGNTTYQSMSIGTDQLFSKVYNSGLSDGQYTFQLKSYVPTYDGDDKSNGRARIKKLVYTISDDDSLLNLSEEKTIDKYLSIIPIVSAKITGLPPLASEGVSKDFDIQLVKTGSIAYDALNFMVDYNPNGEPIDTFIEKGTYTGRCLYGTNGVNIPNKWDTCNDWNEFNLTDNSIYDFSQGFTLQTGSILNSEEIGFISTHIKVRHSDGTYAIWNSDIVGRNNYNYNEVDEFYSTQSSVNIIGMVGATSYDKMNQILEGEAPTMAGGINKSELRSNIDRAVSNLIRGQDGIFTNSEGLVDIFDFGFGDYFMDQDVKVFYYHGDSNPKIILPEKIGFSDKYLLIVEGGDVYVSGNLQHDEGMLGIVVLRKNDKGGHIYVDTEVTNIDALMYADGAIISYKGDPINGTITTQESMSQSDLKNQIYIRGLLWSFNTLGSSRSDIPYCPYFYPDGEVCDLSAAQKYDLEYFRRFYLVKPTVYDNSADDKAWLPYYSPQALLAGGVKCDLQADGTDGDLSDMDVVCTNSNNDLVNKFNITTGNSIINPFGGDGNEMTAEQKKLASPIILEYDGRFKFDYMPIFTNISY